MGDFATLAGALDPDTHIRGKQFERIVKWFLQNDPVYRHEIRAVWLWDDWPRRWGADAGIDLVAEDRNGDLWAIQAKAYDPKYRVSKKDVDKFLAESGRKVFTYRMLIATTNLIDRTGERTIQQQEKRSTFVRLHDLCAAAVDWPASPAHLRPVKPRTPAKPRPHQAEAIGDVLTGFKTSDRGQLIMACGTGKTLTGLFITEKLKAQRTLVLLPSLSLLKQTLTEWRANCTTEFAALPVCSDATVNTADDAAVAHTSDLNVPAETDPEKIAAFLRKSGPLVVFSTYQSSPQIEAAFKLGRVPGFSLIIADEAHRAAGPVSSDFATVLDSSKIKGSRRLFMTATPRYFTGRILKTAQDADFEIASMDDEAKFGPVFHRLSFGNAISRDLLTDYQVAVVAVDDATYRDYADKGTLVTRDGKQIDNAATLAGQIGLAKAMRKYDLRRVISFHSRVKGAREFASSMPDVIGWMPTRQRPKGALWSDVATGELPAGDRYVLLQHLGRLDDADRGLLANARCLSEGVDIPTLDGVAFIDPRRSEVDIVQAVGRAIRKSDAKTVGTIVIPVFIDTNEDPEAALDSSAFKPVWDVIKALRAHDDELAEQLDTLRREMGRNHGKPRIPEKLHLDLPALIGRDFVDAFDARLVEQTTQPWEFWFGLLEKYAEECGHSRAPRGYTLDGYQLGHWINTQRAFKRRGILSEERQGRLDQLSGWAWDPHDDQWERNFTRLGEFEEANGHARVPRSDKQLGVWVQAQRAKFLKGTIENDRRQRLESLTGWTWDPFVDQWEEGFAHLEEYARTHGNARVPGSYCIDAFNLGAWVSTQRQQFGKGKLDDERRRRLEAVATWTWDPQVQQWEEGFAHLVDFVAVHGDARVPGSEVFTGFLLGRWARRQRVAHTQGQLDAGRAARLEGLSGWVWDEIAARWEEGFNHLTAHVAEHGTSLVPFSYRTSDGLRLGQWINVQRNAYAAGTLNDERRERLEQVVDWSWNSRLQLWEDGYTALCRHIEMNGSAAVPYEGVFEGFTLGKWVTTQRRAYSTGKLSKERQERLLRLPGWLWDVKDEQWEGGFAHLFKWVETNGNSALPREYVDPDDGYPVGQWVNNQRAARRRGKLSEERQRKLEALPDWSWDPKSDAWEQKFEVLARYVAKHGDSRVPPGCEFEGVRLSSWCVTQRAAGTRGQLSESRRRRLETLPGWVWDSFDAQWETAFGLLLAFVEREGTSLVPQSHREDGVSLGGWVSQQRGKHVKGVLGAERQRRLEQLPGWSWDPKADCWEAAFALLCAYQLDEHAAAAPRGLVYDGFKLGDWVERQRAAYRKGKLDEDRVQRLESLDVWEWSPKEDQWERGFTALLGYVAEHGDALVPAALVVGGYKLGGWVNTQRLAHLDGTMLQDRCNRLESVSGWSWDPHSDSWNRAFELVEAYAREHGHARVPDKHWVDGFALGAWVVAQRMRRRRGSLVPEREMRLSSLPGWSWGKG
jgi:superfamily II DNA or RNA helicase